MAAIESIVAGVVGGISVAAFNAWRSSMQTRMDRDAEHLSAQIRDLYGPIHFLSESSDGLRRRAKLLMEAQQKVYAEGPQEASDSVALAAVERDMNDCAEFQSRYAERINVNHMRIVDLLEKHYALADVDDLRDFHKFLLNYQLSAIERLDGGKTFPPKIYLQLAPIDYSHPDFPNLVHSRYVEKTERLAELRDHNSPSRDWLALKWDRATLKTRSIYQRLRRKLLGS
jgi:hypothetical protein